MEDRQGGDSDPHVTPEGRGPVERVIHGDDGQRRLQVRLSQQQVQFLPGSL